MIHVTHRKKTRSMLWIPVMLSAVIHFGFVGFSERFADEAKRSYGTSRVEIKVKTPPPPKVPEIKPVEPPKELPKPKPKPKPKKVVRTTRRSNVEKPQPKPAKPAAPVFGATKDSVSNSDSNVAIRVGNTLEKEMERKFTKPEKVASLAPVPKNVPLSPVPSYKLSSMPSFVSKVEPRYPDYARKQGLEGTVQLEVLIDENGKVRKIRVLKAPDKGLAKAAIAALKRSKFNPGRQGNRAVPVQIKIPYRFVLNT